MLLIPCSCLWCGCRGKTSVEVVKTQYWSEADCGLSVIEVISFLCHRGYGAGCWLMTVVARTTWRSTTWHHGACPADGQLWAAVLRRRSSRRLWSVSTAAPSCPGRRWARRTRIRWGSDWRPTRPACTSASAPSTSSSKSRPANVSIYLLIYLYIYLFICSVTYIVNAVEPG